MTQGLVAPRRNSKIENRKLPRFSNFDFRISGFQSRAFIPWAAAALSGLMLVACFPKFHWHGVVWVACLPLLAALAGEKRLKRAFLLGYVCGAFFFAGSCYWFTTVMEFYGHLAPALAVVVLILFVIIDSTFFGGFGLAMGWAARRSPGWALVLSPFLWMAMELARTYLITGFPWNLLGYAVQASGLRQIASVTGVYGLSFLAVATSALLAWVWVSPAAAEGRGFSPAVPTPPHPLPRSRKRERGDHEVVGEGLGGGAKAPPFRGAGAGGLARAAASCPVEAGSASRDRGQGAGDSHPTQRAVGRSGFGCLDSLARPHPTSAARSVQRFLRRTIFAR
jgi:hypothetical protein